MEETQATEAAQPALAAIEIADFVANLVQLLPAELKSKLSPLLPQLMTRIDVDGKAIAIHEGKSDVWKVVQTADGKQLTFVFPSSAQLDQDSKSTDKDVAEKAERMKRFEMRIEKALHHKPPLRLQVKYLPKIDDTTPSMIDAERITAVLTFQTEWR